MTARELIRVLTDSGVDLDLPVYVRGYEGGHDEIEHATLGKVERDTKGAYCGQHTWHTITDAEAENAMAREYDNEDIEHEDGILLSYSPPRSIYGGPLG